MFSILFSSHAVEANSLSKEEHAKLKRELKSINKPSIKTTKVRERERERERENFNIFQVIEGIDPKIIDVFLFPE